MLFATSSYQLGPNFYINMKDTSTYLVEPKTLFVRVADRQWLSFNAMPIAKAHQA